MGKRHDMTAEKRSLTDKLMAIILLETSKDYREMDSDLVTECVDFLMELEGKEKLTKSEIKQRVKEIPFKGKITAIGSYTKKKMRAKRLAVAAAILAVIIALFGVIAIASGNTSFDLLKQVGQTIQGWFEGSSVDYGDITVIKPDGAKKYSSIKELAESEGIEILYPTWLPENEKIVKAWHVVSENTEKYVFQCNNPLHSIEIELDSDLHKELKSNCSQIEINGYSVYYYETSQYMQADFICNKSLYSIKSDTVDNLFRIIENLKEIN